MREPKKVRELLESQGGARTFAQLARAVLLISSRTDLYSGAAERNLAFVDGGIFLMNLLYALHNCGLGACPLMWNDATMDAGRARKEFHVPHDERIIALVAAGHVPETFKVAVSQRVDLADVLVFADDIP